MNLLCFSFGIQLIKIGIVAHCMLNHYRLCCNHKIVRRIVITDCCKAGNRIFRKHLGSTKDLSDLIQITTADCLIVPDGVYLKNPYVFIIVIS